MWRIGLTVFITQNKTQFTNIQNGVAIVNAMAGRSIVDTFISNIDGNFMIMVAWIIKITGGCLFENRQKEAAWRRLGTLWSGEKMEEGSSLLTSGPEGFQG